MAANSSDQVVEYENNTVSLFQPDKAGERYVAYVRPGDQVLLNFDIKDNPDVKVEVVQGDLHLVFADGATITLVSMAAIGFTSNPPILKTMDGAILSLEDFLTQAKVLDYNEALLILANREQFSSSSKESPLVQDSTQQESEYDGGIPVAGQGSADTDSRGQPTTTVDPFGTSENPSEYNGTGSFVVTIYTSEFRYFFDKDNYLPGDMDEQNAPQLTISVFYGSQLKDTGTTDIGGNTYKSYQFENGFNYTTDPFSQLSPSVVDVSDPSNPNYASDIFISNNTDVMNYVFEMNYAKGTFPNSIDIVIPASVADIVTISGYGSTDLGEPYIDEEGNTVYQISSVDSSGKMYFNLSFPQGVPVTTFDISYKITYADPSDGEIKETYNTSSVTLYPVTSENDLSADSGIILSSVSSPMDVKTGIGDDIIVGGGAGNKVESNAGNDQVFSYGGDDTISLGDGNDILWGSAGVDVIDGGAGNDEMYFDNRNTKIDGETPENILDVFYNTYTVTNGLTLYTNFSKADLTSVVTSSFVNLNSIQDGSILTSVSSEYTVVNNVETIYLSKYNDTVRVSQFFDTNMSLTINGGVFTDAEQSDFDTLVIDESFDSGLVGYGANIYLETGTVEKSGGDVLLTFANFEAITGSDTNAEIFYGADVADTETNGTGLEFTLQGGTDTGVSGSQPIDTLSYENSTTAIIFYANSGTVQKTSDVSDTAANSGQDLVSEFEEVVGTSHADIFYGSSLNDYVYSGLDGTDVVDYGQATSGVTWDVASNNIYKTVGITNSEDLSDIVHDEIDTNLYEGSSAEGDNLYLSNQTDVIFASEEGDYVFHAGVGNDIVRYDEMEHGIIVDFSKTNGTQAEITKGFDITYDANGNPITDGTSTGTDSFATMEDGAVNLYAVYGTNYNDVFYMNAGVGTKETHALYGGGGTDMLSYENLTGTFDVTFTFSAPGSSYVTKNTHDATTTGSRDYFYEMEIFVGSEGNDTVRFDNLATIDTVTGLNIDLIEGEDKVDYSQLSASVSDHIDVTFENGNMIVTYADGSTSEFVNTEGVIGTAGDDTFTAIDDVDLSFTGSVGNDTADYSNVTANLIFDMSDTDGDNVTKEKSTDNVIKDTVNTTETIIGGSGTNLYYLTHGEEYTIDGTNSDFDTVSYKHSNQGIVYTRDEEGGVTVTKETGAGTKTDTLTGVEKVKGSNANDLFILADAAGTFDVYGNDVYNADGSPGELKIDNDIIDFSQSTVGLDLVLDSSNDATTIDDNGIVTHEGAVTVNVGLGTYNLYHMEGMIGSDQDDVFVIKSNADSTQVWNIDAGAGEDTVDYSQDLNIGTPTGNGVDVMLGASTTVYRYYGIGAQKIDTLENVETLILTGENDTLNMGEDYADSSVSEIQGLGGTNAVSFAQVSSDIVIDIATDGSFNVDDLILTDFQKIELSQGVSTVNFVEGTTLTGDLIIQGNSVGTSIIDFSGVTSSITLTLGLAGNDVDHISGGVNGDITFLAISEFKLTAGNDTVYASYQKSASFVGNGGNDTLSYENDTVAGIVISIGNVDVDGDSVMDNIVYKSEDKVAYDKFDSDFTTIIATEKDDTLEVATLDDLSVFDTVDMSGGIDTIKLTQVSNVGDAFVNESQDKFLNVEILELSDDDLDSLTIESKPDSDIANMFSYIDGGTGKDELYFTGYEDVVYDVATGKYATGAAYSDTYDEINWATATNGEKNNISGFEVIQASTDSDNKFYASSTDYYEFKGGSSDGDILTYEENSAGINIIVSTQTIEKSQDYDTDSSGATRYSDVFDENIDTIVGTGLRDTITINTTNGVAGVINNLTIDLGDDAGDAIIFDVESAGLENLTISYDSVGGLQVAYNFTGQSSTVFRALGVDTVVATNNNDAVEFDVTNIDLSAGRLFIDGRGEESGGKDSFAVYSKGTNRDVTFDVTTGIVDITDVGGGNSHEVVIVDFESFLVGEGVENIHVSASTAIDYHYGAQGVASDIESYVIDYSAFSTGLTVNFATGTINKDAEGVAQDTFTGEVTGIVGTSGNDYFVLAGNRDGLSDMHIQSGGGMDFVDFSQMTDDFEVIDGYHVFDSAALATGVNGYIIDPDIQGRALTNDNDRYKGDDSSGVTLDGLDGTDILDYSNVDSSVSITADLTTDVGGDSYGTVQKVNTSTAETYNDNVKNFEGIITGLGDDTIKIGDQQTSATIDAGGGNNILDASLVTKDMSVEYGKNDRYESYVSYDGGTANLYNNFAQIALGATEGSVNEVKYYHDSEYESAQAITFTGSLNTDDSFYFASSLPVEGTFDVDGSKGIGDFYISSVGSVDPFLTLIAFDKISAEGTNIALNIVTNGFLPTSFTGGTTAEDTIDYSSVSSAATLTVENGAIKIVTESNQQGDELRDIETITLSDADDDIYVADLGSYTDSSNIVTIYAGGGVNTVFIADSAGSEGVIVDFTSDSGSEGGTYASGQWVIEGYQILGLTSKGDTAYFSEKGSNNINGGEGIDTASYYGNGTFPAAGSAVNLVRSDTGTGDNNIMLISKGVAQDSLESFETYILTDFSDTFSYNASMDNFTDAGSNVQISIDMKGQETSGVGDSVSFRDYAKFSQGTPVDQVGLKFSFDSSALVVTSDLAGDTTTANINYKFTNMEFVTGTQGDDLFVVNSVVPVSLDGGLGNNTLDLTNFAGAGMSIDMYAEDMFDSTGASVGLSFKNFNSVTGNAGIVEYRLGQQNSDGVKQSYTIVTNNDTATISYAKPEANFQGISVDLSADVAGGSNKATVTKSGGSNTDNISGGIGTFIGTSHDDTFNISNDANISGLTIDAGEDEVLGDTLNLSARESAMTGTFVASNADTFTVDGGATFNGFENITFTAAADNVTVDFTSVATLTNPYVKHMDMADDNDNLNILANDVMDINVADKVVQMAGSNYIVDAQSVEYINVETTTNVNIGIDNYISAGILEVNVNGGSAVLDLSKNSVYANLSDDDMSFYDSNNNKKMTATGINDLILGNTTDIIQDSTTIGHNFDIDAGGDTAATGGDEFQYGGDSVSLYLSGAGDITTSSGNMYSNFENITLLGAGETIYIYDSFNASMESIYGNVDSVFTLAGTDSTTVSTRGSSLNLVDKTMQTGTLTFAIGGFAEYNLGDGNDEITVDIDNKSDINANGGANALIFTGTIVDRTYTINGEVGSTDGANTGTYTDITHLYFPSGNVHIEALPSESLAIHEAFNVVINADLGAGTVVTVEGQDMVVTGSVNEEDYYIALDNVDNVDVGSTNLVTVKVNSFANDGDGSPVKIRASTSGIADIDDLNDTGDTADISSMVMDIKVTLVGNALVYVGEDGGSIAQQFSFVDQFYLGVGDDEVAFSTDPGIDMRFFGGAGEDVVNCTASGSTVAGNTITIGTQTTVYEGFESINALSATLTVIDESDAVNPINVKLSSETDSVYVNGMETNKVIDTGVGEDNIYFSGNAYDYQVNQVDEDSVFVDNTWYETGGSYLVVTDENGNSMYFLNSDLDDIESGGIVKDNYDEYAPDIADYSTEKSLVVEDNNNINQSAHDVGDTYNEVQHAFSNDNFDLSGLLSKIETAGMDDNVNHQGLDIVAKLSNTLINESDNMDVSLIDVVSSKHTTSEDMLDTVNIMDDSNNQVNEADITEQEVTNSYKLSDEKSDDVLQSFHQALNKNHSNSGGGLL